MKLYEIEERYEDFLNLIEEEEIPDEVVKDTLEAIEGEFTEKIDNIACLVKNLDAQILAIEGEVKKLTKRKKTKENNIKRLKRYVYDNMNYLGKKKIETPRNVISVRKNPMKIFLEDGFIDWAKENADDLLKYNEPTVNKSAIKEAINDGRKICFAQLRQEERLDIR